MNRVLKVLDSIVYNIIIVFILVGIVLIESSLFSIPLAVMFIYLIISLLFELFKYKKPVILFAKTRADAIIPTRENGNAGFDVYGLLPTESTTPIVINPHETKLISTGIKSIIPEGYYVQIQERGSTGSKGIKYSAGVIDSSYRGEWFLATTNTNDKPVVFYKDSRYLTESEYYIDNSNINKDKYKDCILYPLSKAIFQGVIHSVHEEIVSKEVSLETIDSNNTNRGEGKLGSSGK